MTARWSPKVGAYALLAGLAVALALLAGRPGAAAFAAPFALVLAVALPAPAPRVRGGTLRAARARAVEGDDVALALALDLEGAARVDVAAPVTPDAALDGHAAALPGAPAALSLTLRARRPAVYVVGPVVVRAVDALGTRAAESTVGAEVPVRVDPRRLALRTPVFPRAAAAVAGSRTAATAGEGLEFADVRPHVAGEPARRVHWRATARSGRLHVTERHPEHQGDVVLLVDRSLGASLVRDDAVRAGAVLAHRLLRDRDRVGLLLSGDGAWWLPGDSGRRQERRIVDALVEWRPRGGVAWRDATFIARRAVPPGALVLALSPLVDRWTADMLLDLRGRGMDVAALEIDPATRLPRPAGEEQALVQRLWALERDARRRMLRAAGIGVGTWRAGRPLDEATTELNRWRRAARVRSA